MAPLAFLLECAAIAAFTGAAASVLVLTFFLLVRPLTQRWAPARRADLFLVLGVTPAVVSVAVVLAAAAPSIMGPLGLVNDHCPTHQHHVHLCLVHSSGLRPLLATVGAMALAIFLFRVAALAKRVIETSTRLRALETLGVRQDRGFPIIAVPAGPRLCHSVGIFRRRILISADLSQAIAGEEMRAALAHEEAHLRRRDPAAVLGLSVASLFVVPAIAQLFRGRFQEAIEEACDAEAAKVVGNPRVVALALVNVAALQRSSVELAALGPAFGETALERRVHLLLQDDAVLVAPARATLLVLGGSFLAMGCALFQTQYLHHAVETLLHRFF